jgi:medium-chain acyl-[acyl-carrier-protein] hydrolase
MMLAPAPGTGRPTGSGNRWLPGGRRPRATARLFCFPHAGAGASTFVAWRRLFAPTIDVCGVQCPGREERIAEAPFTSMSALVGALLEVFAAERVPFALFGHSTGALVAYELARALDRAGAPGPSALVVSGCRSPERLMERPPMHALDEGAFRCALRDLGGTPAALLDDVRYMDLVSPGIRADFQLRETYAWEPRTPLDLPVLALVGTNDPLARAAGAEGWRHHTSASFEMREVPGDHLFIRQSRGTTVSLISDFLVRHVLGARQVRRR